MANRYWVGGSGNWNTINTANWSTSSGGAGGASVPTSSDDVIIDNSSGVSGSIFTITLQSDVICRSFTHNRPASGSYTNISGDIYTIVVITNIEWNGEGGICSALMSFGGDYSNNMTLNPFGAIKLKCTNAMSTQNITGTNGGFSLEIVGANVTLSLDSPTISSLVFSSTVAKTLTLSQELTLTGDMQVFNNCTVSGNTVKLVPNSSNPISLLVDGSIGSLKISGTYSSQIFSFKGNGSVSNLTKTATIPFTLQFDTTSNIKIQTWGISGTAGNLVTVKSNVSGVRSKITKTGGGVVSTDYMNVIDMQPYPDNTWISYNSTNAGNNWQWYFDNFTKPTSSLFFGNHV